MTRYKFDTHVHTAETSSCGKIPAEELVKLYKDAGYYGIVITDHYYAGFFESLDNISWEEKIDAYLKGYKNALAAGEKTGLKVLLGMELRFNENVNDYLVFGFDESYLKERPELYKLGLNAFRDSVKNTGIMIFQAHPYRTGIVPADPFLLDGVEIFNGNPRHDSRNHLACSFAKENKLLTISGSDFHQLPDLARGGILMSENINTTQEFLQIIKEQSSLELIKTEA